MFKKFLASLKEMFSSLFKKQAQVVTPVNSQPQPKVATVAPVYTPQPGDTPVEVLVDNAARLTAGLSGNGTQGPRPDPILTPGADTPEGRAAWMEVQRKMNAALMGNGPNKSVDDPAPTARVANGPPAGYVTLPGDGNDWPVDSPQDPASLWRYPGDLGYMTRDEMYAKRVAWLHKNMPS